MVKKAKKKVKKAKKKTKKDTAKPEEKEQDEDFWEEDDVLEEDVEEDEDVDVSKTKFTKLKDLEVGMEHVNIEATIDFVGDVMGKGYGEAPFAIGFLKDDSGEVKITFWGDDIKSAKPKKKVRVMNCSIGEYRNQLQIYPDRKKGVEFI